MKKRILFIFPDMILGGATTALIALLKKIDYEKNQVDLLFLNNGGYRTDEISGQVNILPDAAKENLSGAKARIKKRFHLLFSGNIFRVLAWALKNKPSRAYFIAALNQALAQANSALSHPADKEYELAVSFLEMWPTVYLANHIKAKKKIVFSRKAEETRLAAGGLVPHRPVEIPSRCGLGRKKNLFFFFSLDGASLFFPTAQVRRT